MRKYYKFFLPCYEGDGGGAGAAGAAGATGDPPPTGDKTFTQEQVNSILAKQKRELQEKNTGLMSEIEALQKKQSLSAEERKQLESRVEELRKANMTAEQLKSEDEKKLRNKFESEINNLTSERDKWKTNFTNETIQRAIVDASAANDAFVPAQVVAILKPQTRLVEDVDDEGKPKGVYTPKVTFEDTKEGKPVTLELSVADAVKRMSEMDQYLNLFKGKGSGGIGSNNKGGSGGTLTAAEAAKLPPQEYRKWREKNGL